MITTTIFPGRYVQGYDALKRLGVEIKWLFLLSKPWMLKVEGEKARDRTPLRLNCVCVLSQ